MNVHYYESEILEIHNQRQGGPVANAYRSVPIAIVSGPRWWGPLTHQTELVLSLGPGGPKARGLGAEQASWRRREGCCEQREGGRREPGGTADERVPGRLALRPLDVPEFPQPPRPRGPMRPGRQPAPVRPGSAGDRAIRARRLQW